MYWPEIQASGSNGGDDGGDRKRGVHLQGPRPSPLSVNKESRKIGKPPLPGPPYHPPRAPPQAKANREPVIIYAVSPKVIHTEASNFMSVVQRLTGLCNSSSTGGASTSAIPVGGPISPAARLAVLEKASPPERERERERARALANIESELMGMMSWEAVEVDLGHLPGILSPAPANLPTVMPEMFSAAVEPQNLFGIQDSLMSPWGYGSYFPGSPSSSALFSAGTLFSPAPSPAFDISTLFDISVNTMESRILPRLFFAGEVLNVDGVTGGFNFQNAWSGGYIAGTTIGNLALSGETTLVEEVS